MSNPLISICMLSYNHEQYVAESIESVLTQTYKNIELIIVDNASEDRTKEIIEFYTNKDNRISFYPMEENTFVSYGINYAIQQAKGEFIATLSADDYFEKDKISIQLAYMLKSGITNSFTWINSVNDQGEKIESPIETQFNQEFTWKSLQKYFLIYGNTLCAVTCIFHKSIFEKYGYFDNRLLQAQDFDLWLRIIKYEPLYILPQQLTNYRVRDDGDNLSINMTTEAKNRSIFETVYFMKHILDFDLDLLTEVVGSKCTVDNKYKMLFEFYKKNEQHMFSTAILFAMYEDLGPQFDFPSEMYKDFFQIYSKHDLFQDNRINQLTEIITTKDNQIIELNTLAHKQEEEIERLSLKNRVKSLLGLK